MKKSIYFLALSVLPFMSFQAEAAEAIGYNISAQLVCKTSKSGTETVAVSGRGSYVGIADHSVGVQGLASLFTNLGATNPYPGITDATFKSTEIPCTTAKAVIDNQALVNFCATTIGLDLHLLASQSTTTTDPNTGTTTTTTIGGSAGANFKLTSKPTASVALGNGLIVYNWDSVCLFPAVNTAAGLLGNTIP